MEDTGRSSRFNDPGLFESSLRTISVGSPQPIAVLFSGPGPRAAVVGTLSLRKDHPGVGRLSGAMPGLRTLRIQPTVIVTDSTSEAVAAVGTFVTKALLSGALDRADLDGVGSGGCLEAALEQGGGKLRCLRQSQTRFYRRLIDPESGQVEARDPAQPAQSRSAVRRRSGICPRGQPGSDRLVPAMRGTDR